MAYLAEGYPPNIKEMKSIQIKKFSIIENIMLLFDGKVDCDIFYYSLHQFLSNLYEYLGKYLALTKVEEDNKSLKLYHHQLGKLLTQIIRSKLETYWEKLWSIEKQ